VRTVVGDFAAAPIASTPIGLSPLLAAFFQSANMQWRDR
jgi:hypothetical protein